VAAVPKVLPHELKKNVVCGVRGSVVG
jgi:hypothetical protein